MALDANVTKLAIENSKLKDEVKRLMTTLMRRNPTFSRAGDHSSRHSCIIVFYSKAFGAYVNRCGMTLTPITLTDIVKLICFDFPNLDIKRRYLWI